MRQDGHRDATVAIITALPVEAAAMTLLIDDIADEHVGGDPRRYFTGTMPSAEAGRPHRVVLGTGTWTGDASAVAAVTNLLRSYPNVQTLVLCGLAAGVGTGVQLGDVVVAVDGVVGSDLPRAVGDAQLRRRSSRVSAVLRRADIRIAMAEQAGASGIERLMERAASVSPQFRRPEYRRPRIHRGAIGSAYRLIRDVRARDTLAAEYGVAVVAVDMEAGDIAASAVADSVPQGWLVVRGISDFGDSKDDSWQAGAALAAAAYTRVLLGACRPFVPNWLRDDRPSLPQLAELVDLLLEQQPMRDDYGLRTVMTSLPGDIRAAVPYHPVPRFQVISMLRTCARFPGGMAALLDAVRLATAPDAVTLRRLSVAFEAYGEQSV